MSTLRSRQMQLTPDLVARCYRPVVETPGRFVRATESELAAITARLLQDLEGPLWVFAYGSLIWKPCFEAVETRRGVAPGWHRAFTVRLLGFRGTVDRPGLMMALARGGRCAGLVLRAADGAETEVVSSLVRRELPYREFRDMVRWISVDTGHGKVRALVFWAGRFAPADASGLSDAEVAEMIASACGYGGSCAEYLYETLAGLERHGIRDRHLWRLQALVAEAIARQSGLPPRELQSVPLSGGSGSSVGVGSVPRSGVTRTARRR